MNNNEIKAANRKAMPMFVLMIVLGAVLGGAIGFFSAVMGLDSFAAQLGWMGERFGECIAPWLIVAIALIVPLVAFGMYRRAMALLARWDGEDEAVSQIIDLKLSEMLWIGNVEFIVSFFLLAAVYSGGVENIQSNGEMLKRLLSLVAFIAIMIETTIIQQKSVDACKQMAPEKKTSVYDLKFQKKWMDSCDEAEKILIGKCAYKAFGKTNLTCAILAAVLAVGAIIWDIGFLPSLTVCLIWLVNVTTYTRASVQLSKPGSKII